MRVLYVTTEVPRLGTGFQRHLYFLRQLGREHRITLLSLTRLREVPPAVLAELEPLVEDMEIFGLPEADEPPIVHALGRAPSARLQRAARLRLAARELERAAHRRLGAEPFDLIFFSGKDTYPAIRHATGVPVVVDCCDATSVRVRGEMRVAGPGRRLWLTLRYLEVRRIERQLLARTPHLAFASERDRAGMGGPPDAAIIPQGLDLGRWTRRGTERRPQTIVFTGLMTYPPNHDAAMLLVESILPRVRAQVPGAEARIVGRGPQPALVAAARGAPGVTLVDRPADIRSYLEDATVACAPVRFASGMQFKVLEAMAMEVPVVTTPAAAAGLTVEGAAPPVLVARDEAELAAELVRLLGAPEERAALARAGRRFVEDHFAWERSIATLESMWWEAVGGAEPAGDAPAAGIAGRAVPARRTEPGAPYGH